MKRLFNYARYLSKKLWLKMKYGKYGHWRYMMAEDAVVEKIPVIDQLYTKKEREACFKRGFNSDKLVWYGKEKMDKGTYVTDYEHYVLFEAIDQKQYYVADDKLVCERMMSPFCRVLPTLGYIVNGNFFPIGDDKEIKSYVDFVTHIDKGEEFCIKPNYGGSGRGIGMLAKRDGSYWWNDQKVENLHEFIRTFNGGKGYLVQRRFKQFGFSHDYNPDTLNTIRIVTMLDPETNEPFVAWCFHRFGRKGNFVDNVAAGNMLCPIVPDTGVMQYGLIPPINGELKKVDKHPDSQVQISGVKIPHWEEMKQFCFSLSKQVPFLPLCGWDIILSDDEFTMQELNYNPDIYPGQMLYPLLEDEKVMKFYEHYKKQYMHG